MLLGRVFLLAIRPFAALAAPGAFFATYGFSMRFAGLRGNLVLASTGTTSSRSGGGRRTLGSSRRGSFGGAIAGIVSFVVAIKTFDLAKVLLFTVITIRGTS